MFFVWDVQVLSHLNMMKMLKSSCGAFRGWTEERQCCSQQYLIKCNQLYWTPRCWSWVRICSYSLKMVNCFLSTTAHVSVMVRFEIKMLVSALMKTLVEDMSCSPVSTLREVGPDMQMIHCQGHENCRILKPGQTATLSWKRILNKSLSEILNHLLIWTMIRHKQLMSRGFFCCRVIWACMASIQCLGYWLMLTN